MDSIINHPLALSIIVALPLFGVIARLFGATFRRIARWYLYLAVFAVVVVMNSIFFPFIGGKDYFFRYAVELALMAYALFWAFEAGEGEVWKSVKEAARKPLAIAVTAFAAMFLLASLFAYDMHAAFWSNYERGEGGFQMLHYYAFFALLVLLFNTEKEWKNLFRFSLVAAGGMILYGILGNYAVQGTIGPYTGNVAPVGWWHTLIDGRFQGSLGNPAYVAPYLMFSMFYAGYLWVRRTASAPASRAVRAWTGVGWGALIAVFVFFFFISQTRGAFLGLGAGLFVFTLYLAIAGRGKMRKWAGAVAILLVVLGGTIYALRKSPITNMIPEGRLLQISLSDATAQTRLWVWGEAWHGFLERPVLGWGPENFTAVYDKFFNPKFFVPGQNGETWFDRAHSVYFDYLAETGILGLLAYLSIWAVFFTEFARRHRHGNDRSPKAIVERGMILAMPVAYLVQGVAIFDVFPMYLNVFLFAGFAYWYFYHHHGQNA